MQSAHLKGWKIGGLRLHDDQPRFTRMLRRLVTRQLVGCAEGSVGGGAATLDRADVHGHECRDRVGSSRDGTVGWVPAALVGRTLVS